MLRTTCFLLTFILATVVFPQIPSTQAKKNSGTPQNLSSLKAYFDIKADSAAKVEKRLVWINDIYEQMHQKSLEATFIIGFRSQASFFVTKEDDYIDEEDLLTKKRIDKWLKHFANLGIPMEQCGLSAKLFDIDAHEFLPEINIVPNGYISMINYQNKGYAYVPM